MASTLCTGAVYNIDNARSFATEKNLQMALVRLGFNTSRHVVVCNRAGRFTAIFPASAAEPDMARFARAGFFTLG